MAAHIIPAEELTPSVSVTEQEYLRTSYEPDCDYLDGRVEERNVGEYEHSGVQGAILNMLFNHAAQWGVKARPECRLQVPPTKYSVPDVMVLRREQRVSRIVREAPLICIEVLRACSRSFEVGQVIQVAICRWEAEAITMGL